MNESIEPPIGVTKIKRSAKKVSKELKKEIKSFQSEVKSIKPISEESKLKTYFESRKKAAQRSRMRLGTFASPPIGTDASDKFIAK